MIALLLSLFLVPISGGYVCDLPDKMDSISGRIGDRGVKVIRVIQKKTVESGIGRRK